MLTENTINTLILTLSAVNPALLAGGLTLATLIFVSSPRFAFLNPLKQKLRSAIINITSPAVGLLFAYASVPVLGLVVRGLLIHNPLAFASFILAGSIAAVNNPRVVLRYAFKAANTYLTNAYKTGSALGDAASTSIIDENLIVTSAQALYEEAKHSIKASVYGESTPVIPVVEPEDQEAAGPGLITQFSNYAANIQNPFAGYSINRQPARYMR